MDLPNAQVIVSVITPEDVALMAFVRNVSLLPILGPTSSRRLIVLLAMKIV